jgi:hypothetical protein
MNRRKIIYSILREIVKGEKEPKAADYGLTDIQFQEIVMMMQDEGLIKNAAFASTITWLNTATITLRGLDYLDENSAWAKAYNTAKEIREWIKL